MRDSQRSKVYKCDNGLLLWGRETGASEQYPTRWEMQYLADRVQKWAAAKRGRVATVLPNAPRVVIRRGVRSRANQAQWTIKMCATYPDFNFNTVMVLHELAHLYAPAREKHGPAFCATYLTLVREFMGEAAAEELVRLFKLHRVKYRVVRKRSRGPVSPERRAALIEQLARARAAKAARTLTSAA